MLFACLGRPTILVEAESLKDNIGTVAATLLAKLEAAGVTGLKMPSNQQLQEEFGAFIKPPRKRDVDLSEFQMTRSQVCPELCFLCRGLNTFRSCISLSVLSL